MRTKATDMFLAAGAHMLLDFHSRSNAVLNTDFRIGGGFRGRLVERNDWWLSWQAKFYHESNHLGDEYLADAIGKTGFEWHNVSSNAFEAYVAIDKFSPKTELYRRVYVGGRLLNNDREGAHPLFNGKKELQIGGELFIREPLGCQRFDHLVFAGEIYWRTQLAHASPQLVPSINLVTGIILGRYFKQYILDMDSKKGTKFKKKVSGKKAVTLLLNFYHGVNPQGQFRRYKISYLGFSVGVSI